MFLDKNTFETVLTSTPLVSINLVAKNPDVDDLLSYRNNHSAVGFWFVPGGRVFKYEKKQQAFIRISKDELGIAFNIDKADLLDVYDYCYAESVFGSNISTHYSNTPYLLRLHQHELIVSSAQHSSHRWMSLSYLTSDNSVYKFRKVFMPQLYNVVGRNDDNK